MTNREEFLDTQRRIAEDETLSRKMRVSRLNTRVYGEGYLSSETSNGKECCIEVTEESTFEAARRLSVSGHKVAALNFANPFTPGGGVLHGANAQEECLCRMSTLYHCLISDNAKKYYETNVKLRAESKHKSMITSSDFVIYSPSVTIFKQEIVENGCRRLAYTDHWVDVDVVTCAAPCFVFQSLIKTYGVDNLFQLFVKRIKNIFEVCMGQQVEELILGAFGCGVFHNPPELVARAFQAVLHEKRYQQAFQKTVFAILSNKSNRENYITFYNVLMQ